MCTILTRDLSLLSYVLRNLLVGLLLVSSLSRVRFLVWLENNDGTAVGLNIFRLLIPIEEARATSVSKQSSVKCTLHNFESSVGVHLARVVWNLLIQILLLGRSLGKLKKLTPSL